MKNLKILMVALALLAIPAFAFGQVDVSCDSCTHDVSVYMGEGGVVATADGAEKVTWVTTCSGVTRSGELTADDDGMVAALFSMDNGLACMATGKDMGSFQIGPVKDGGWFWITDDMNSAVGALVAQDIQMNDKVDITSAGAGVTMTAGTGAVYLKETATGRVGILPNILPEPPKAPPTPCGYSGTARVSTNCMLGDGKTKIVANRTSAPMGAVASMATVTRPAANVTGGDVTVQFNLLGNGTGHFTTASDGDVKLGHVATVPLTATFSGKYGSGGINDPDLSTSAANGLTLTEAGLLTVQYDSDYCPTTAGSAKHTAVVRISADATSAGEVTPSIAENAAGDEAATFRLMVACAGAASSPNMGTELVPDNPFPTE